MQIPEQATIIAPGSLHLPLYEEIYRTRGNSLGIHVVSIENYIYELLDLPRQNTLDLLYQIRDSLQDLPEDNAFYESRNDYSFLSACLKFLTQAALYQIHDFPEKTKKQIDIAQIMERLKNLDIWQKKLASCKVPDPDHVYILSHEYTEKEQPLIDWLKLQNVRFLEEPAEKEVFYWSASNIRKAMEVMADTIVSRGMQADQIFVALARNEDQQVLSQIFHSRSIPFTFLHTMQVSAILLQFKAALTYILHPQEENRMKLLRAFYPESGSLLREYMELFPQGSDLENLEYEPNPVISEKDFLHFKDLEAQAAPWKPVLIEFEHWDYTQMELIASRIQEANPNPGEDDLKAFDQIMNAIIAVKDRIHSNEDLELLLHHLDTLFPASTLDGMQGVLVGTRNDISSLRPIVFYIGADEKSFPGYTMQKGVFDEDYLKDTDYPSLQNRLSTQKENLYHALSLPEELFIISPQSDYEGKTIESSHDLNAWLGKFPQFQSIPDSSTSYRPDFSLTSDLSSGLFSKDQIMRLPIQSLASYERCPLQHMLRYGLKLKTPFRFKDQLSVNAEIFEMILSRAQLVYQKPFTQLTPSQLESLIEEEFRFARKVFPHEQMTIDVLKKEYSIKIRDLCSILDPLLEQTQTEMEFQDYKLNLDEEVDGVHVQIDGSLNPSRFRDLAVNLYSLNRSENPQDPKASMALRLDFAPVWQEAYKNSYGRSKAVPAQATAVTQAETEAQFLSQFMKDNIVAQDLNPVEDETLEKSIKKLPTYQNRIEQSQQVAAGFIASLKSNCILPEHTAGACKSCPFASICRNGATEKKKG